MATAWFTGIAVGPAAAGHRVAYLYHAAMMLAMVWMYAVMNGTILSGHSAADNSRHHRCPPGMGITRCRG